MDVEEEEEGKGGGEEGGRGEKEDEDEEKTLSKNWYERDKSELGDGLIRCVTQVFQ